MKDEVKIRFASQFASSITRTGGKCVVLNKSLIRTSDGEKLSDGSAPRIRARKAGERTHEMSDSQKTTASTLPKMELPAVSALPFGGPSSVTIHDDPNMTGHP